MKAFHNGTFFTMNEQNEVISNGLLLEENGEITYIGPFKKELFHQSTEKVNLLGKWVMPGLVNTHSHIVMTILRGIGDDMLLKPWLETKIWPLENKFTPEIGVASSILGVLEMIKSGTTTFNDMYNPNNIDPDAIMDALAKTGIRGAFSHTIFSFGTKEEQQQNLREAERFAKTYKAFADGRLTTMVAPHSPYTCTPHALEESARIAKEHDLFIHIHLSETEGEVETILSQYGVRPVEHVLRSQIFHQPTLIAHGVVLNDEERQILKEYDVRVAHNPISNLKLGSGIADIPKLLETGIKVGIATDSVASNNNFDLFEEARTAALLQKGTYKDATKMDAKTTLAMATRIGAEAIGMNGVGSLEIGKRADFITIDASSKPHLQPVSEAYSHLLYAANGQDVTDVYIDGKQIVKDRECVTIDEEKIMAEVNRLQQTLVK